jgi:hypothetical protein
MAEKGPSKAPPRSRVQSGPVLQQRKKQSTPFKTWRSDVGATASSTPASTRLVYKEVNGNLFECPPDCSLGHCVSEDLAMRKGVATYFREMFGSIEELKAQGWLNYLK